VLSSGPRRVSQTPGGEGVYQDITLETELLTFGSMRPIHQICLEAERLQMARAFYIINKLCEPERVLSILVDGIFLQPTAAQRKKLKKAFEELKYSDLPELRARFEDPVPDNFLLDRAAHIYKPVDEAPSSSQDLVYKFIERGADGSAVEPKLPGGKLHYHKSPCARVPALGMDCARGAC